MDEEKILENDKIEEEPNETCDCGCCGCGDNEEVEEVEEICDCGCCGNEGVKVEEDTCHCEKKSSFLKNLGIVIIDQVIVVAISMLCVLVFNLIIRYGFGLFILTEYYGTFLLIAYLIVNILYTTIMETKIASTFGKNIIK